MFFRRENGIWQLNVGVISCFNATKILWWIECAMNTSGAVPEVDICAVTYHTSVTRCENDHISWAALKNLKKASFKECIVEYLLNKWLLITFAAAYFAGVCVCFLEENANNRLLVISLPMGATSPSLSLSCFANLIYSTKVLLSLLIFALAYKRLYHEASLRKANHCFISIKRYYALNTTNHCSNISNVQVIILSDFLHHLCSCFN